VGNGVTAPQLCYYAGALVQALLLQPARNMLVRQRIAQPSTAFAVAALCGSVLALIWFSQHYTLEVRERLTPTGTTASLHNR